ncbi:hypothetical protein BH18ACT4_BH18ACT4_11800 [soil metagenome]
MESQLERILGADYLGRLEERPIEELRSMRSQCQDIESGLSYLRRLVQGRLDIVAVQREARRAGSEPGDLTSLIERLPEILSDRTRSNGPGRPPQPLAPGEIDPALENEFAEVVAGHDVESLPELDDYGLADLHDRLEDLERRVSARRRDLFDRIDALQAEITRRYRIGDASVETLLQ